MINLKLLYGSQKEKGKEGTLGDESSYCSFSLGKSFVAISSFRNIFLHSRYGRNHTSASLQTLSLQEETAVNISYF